MLRPLIAKCVSFTQKVEATHYKLDKSTLLRGTLVVDRIPNHFCVVIMFHRSGWDNIFRIETDDKVDFVSFVRKRRREDVDALIALAEEGSLSDKDLFEFAMSDERMQLLEKLLCNTDYDIEVVVRPNAFGGHKAVLETEPFFRMLFESGLTDRRISLEFDQDYCIDAFSNMYTFIMTGQVEFEEYGSAMELALLSNRFGVASLTVFCVRHLIASLCAENAIFVLLFAIKMKDGDPEMVPENIVDYFIRGCQKWLDQQKERQVRMRSFVGFDVFREEQFRLFFVKLCMYFDALL